VKKLPALLACLLLPASCRLVHGAFESSAGVGWGNYAIFSRDLTNPSLLNDYPFLRDAPVYHLSLTVAPDLKSAEGRMSVRFTNTEPKALPWVELVLLPNIAAGSLTVRSVEVDGLREPAELREDKMVLRVSFPAPLAPGARAVISVRYSLEVPDQPAVGFGGFQLSHGILSLGYAYPMIPTGARWPYGKPARWGDLTANPVSYYVVDLSYPSALTLAAPGVVVKRSVQGPTEHVLIAHGPARDLFLALGSDLVASRLRVGQVEISSFAPKADAEASSWVLDDARGALESFEKRFGPYPYRSLTFVAAPFEAYGLEFPGIIVLTSWLANNATRTVHSVPVRRLLESTVAHETAHQWFYALVGNNQITEPWIDESFAQYATWLYYLDRYGAEAAGRFFRSFDATWRLVGDRPIPIGQPVSAYTPREYDADIYGRGPLFLAALSSRMGAPAFDRFAHDLQAQYRWKTVTSAQVEQSAERACECSLGSLWSAWVGGPGPRVAAAP